MIAVEGGMPKRLTWHPGPGRRPRLAPRREARAVHERPPGRSARRPRLSRRPRRREPRGAPDAEGQPRGLSTQTGARIAYTPIRDAFRSWKRYRGGRTVRSGSSTRRRSTRCRFPHVNASDTFPCWLGGDGVVRLRPRRPHERLAVHAGRPRARAGHALHGLRRPQHVVGRRRGGVRAGGRDPPPRSRVRQGHEASDRGPERRPRRAARAGRTRRASCATPRSRPNGKRAAFEVRGEIVTLPKENGDARNLTDSPGVHDRDPVWSPDGKKVAWFSDEGGEYRLLVRDHQGLEPCEVLRPQGRRLLLRPGVEPRRQARALQRQDEPPRLRHARIGRRDGGRDLAGIARRRRATRARGPPTASGSRSRRAPPERSTTASSSTRSRPGRSSRSPTGSARRTSPAFSCDGKYLFFRASIDSGPRRFGLDMSTSLARPATSNLYVAVLQKSEKNPIAPKSDEADDPGQAEEGRRGGARRRTTPRASRARRSAAASEPQGDARRSTPTGWTSASSRCRCPPGTTARSAARRTSCSSSRPPEGAGGPAKPCSRASTSRRRRPTRSPRRWRSSRSPRTASTS